MIGWITDNPLSRTVMESIPGIEIRHIKHFEAQSQRSVSPGGLYAMSPPSLHHQHVFYGILRGCCKAMHILEHYGWDYHYIDNGYFDALYVDKNMHKSMEGKFRVVKNGMHEVYPYGGEPDKPQKILILPPSTYSANFYDTTPEDWQHSLMVDHSVSSVLCRTKDTKRSLEDDLSWCEGVMSFNSMAVMKAIEMGKSVCDTHGVFRKPGFFKYDIEQIKNFYGPKQFTLQEFREGKCKWE